MKFCFEPKSVIDNVNINEFERKINNMHSIGTLGCFLLYLMNIWGNICGEVNSVQDLMKCIHVVLESQISADHFERFPR